MTVEIKIDNSEEILSDCEEINIKCSDCGTVKKDVKVPIKVDERAIVSFLCVNCGGTVNFDIKEKKNITEEEYKQYMEQTIKDWEKEWKSPSGKRRVRFDIPYPNGKKLGVYLVYSEKDRLNPEFEFDEFLMETFNSSLKNFIE